MLISSDGHATALQENYLDCLDPEIRTDFKEWLEGAGPAYVGINAHPDVDPAVNFDSQLRLRDLETQGVVAEVLFPNSLPFGYAAEGTHSDSRRCAAWVAVLTPKSDFVGPGLVSSDRRRRRAGGQTDAGRSRSSRPLRHWRGSGA